ncbi:MAG TPA: hypothetical protein VGM88_09595 [Kofleriaceae bacterium]|jgi:hypothetical protein
MKLAASLALALLVPLRAAAAPACDTSTERKQHAAYKRVTGQDWIGPENFYEQTCLVASTTFAGLMTTGTFATEVGCQWLRDEPADDYQKWTGAIYDCRFHKTSLEVAADAMSRAGWAKADAAARANLAWAWVREVEHFEPMESAYDPWPKGGAKFSAPAAKAKPDGGATLTFWISLPTMGQGVAFRELAIDFSPKGVPSTPRPITEIGGPSE